MGSAPAPWAGQSYAPPIPLDLATIETAMVAQLRTAAQAAGSALAQVEIAHFPDRAESYRMTHRVGAVLLRYGGARYGDSLASGNVVQRRTLEWDVYILARDLGWAYGGPASGVSPGAYAIIDAVRLALVGYQVTGTTKIRLTRDQFEERDREGGVWIYSLTLTLETLAVEVSPDENYQPLTKAMLLDRGTTTARPVQTAQYTFDVNSEIALAYQNISAVVVTNPSTHTAYALGVDYAVDEVNGIISRAATGAIPGGATVEVAYSYAEITTALAGGGTSPTAPNN